MNLLYLLSWSQNFTIKLDLFTYVIVVYGCLRLHYLMWLPLHGMVLSPLMYKYMFYNLCRVFTVAATVCYYHTIDPTLMMSCPNVRTFINTVLTCCAQPISRDQESNDQVVFPTYIFTINNPIHTISVWADLSLYYINQFVKIGNFLAI